ncbi:flavin-containing monooxygenase [Paenibacillus glycinis]|uniref:FAD-dependent oxidoreductase n=1 Tax=Paenibacillus glycinis TaxID=2697035 RepID=A0ABW9XYF4_9BACL|nr:NAD(P)/FAD-dependent oxidoreductase [Paenibacillus glycinis]NBD27266.1 FAD-dependent oxidoreductase [Paenibacillus glycinis]
MREQVDVVIIGAGQAGLAVSYHLTERGCGHVILEKERIGASWRKKWDSFHLVTPNWMLQLPGFPYAGTDPDGFLTRDEVTAYLERYAERFQPRIRTLPVTAVRMNPDARTYAVEASGTTILAKNVVVATGAFQKKKVPAIGARIDESIAQLHSSEYRNPHGLSPGSVLVIGAGQSGCHIAKELNESGRRVYLSVGGSGRQPRRYRGKDTMRWASELGMYDQPAGLLGSPAEKFASSPYVSGRNRGEDIHLRRFALDGITLLGRLRDIRGTTVKLRPDLLDSLAQADEFAEAFMDGIDHYISKSNLIVPEDDARMNDERLKRVALPIIEELDLAAAGITTIVWATGYAPDFEWIDLPVRDRDGYPVHDRGVANHPGLYFIGLAWLHKAKSPILYGVGEDAAYISSHIADRLSM